MTLKHFLRLFTGCGILTLGFALIWFSIQWGNVAHGLVIAIPVALWCLSWCIMATGISKISHTLQDIHFTREIHEIMREINK